MDGDQKFLVVNFAIGIALLLFFFWPSQSDDPESSADAVSASNPVVVSSSSTDSNDAQRGNVRQEQNRRESLKSNYYHTYAKWQEDYAYFCEWRDSEQERAALVTAVTEWNQEISEFDPADIPAERLSEHREMQKLSESFLQELI